MTAADPRGRPEIVAHRGDAEHFPENTLPAIAAALQAGLRHVEFDVQLSADAVPFVIHDARLERTTTGHGDLRNIEAGVLDGVDASEPRRLGARHAGTRIPRLAAVAQLLPAHAGATAFVELKRASLAQHGTRRCIEAVREALGEAASQCVLISFDAEACREARDITGLPIGWVFAGDPDAQLGQLQALAPEYAFCDQAKIPEGPPLPAGPWRWAVYEVTGAAQALSLCRRGAALVESMAPLRLRAALDRAAGGA